METNKPVPISELSEDVLCALVARNEVRKLGHTPESSPAQFGAIFSEYLEVKKSANEKQAVQFEKDRKKKLLQYLKENLMVNDIEGNLTLVITQ